MFGDVFFGKRETDDGRTIDRLFENKGGERMNNSNDSPKPESNLDRLAGVNPPQAKPTNAPETDSVPAFLRDAVKSKSPEPRPAVQPASKPADEPKTEPKPATKKSEPEPAPKKPDPKATATTTRHASPLTEDGLFEVMAQLASFVERTENAKRVEKAFFIGKKPYTAEQYYDITGEQPKSEKARFLFVDEERNVLGEATERDYALWVYKNDPPIPRLLGLR